MNSIERERNVHLKLERSRKLSVEIGREEKKGCDGSVTGVGRCCEPRVIIERSRPFNMAVRMTSIDQCKNIMHLEGQCPDAAYRVQVYQRCPAGSQERHDS
jgi:hypothetical protein